VYYLIVAVLSFVAGMTVMAIFHSRAKILAQKELDKTSSSISNLGKSLK